MQFSLAFLAVELIKSWFLLITYAALKDLFSHYMEAWKSWYSEVAGKKPVQISWGATRLDSKWLTKLFLYNPNSLPVLIGPMCACSLCTENDHPRWGYHIYSNISTFPQIIWICWCILFFGELLMHWLVVKDGIELLLFRCLPYVGVNLCCFF